MQNLKRPYSKLPISIKEQIEKLKGRGLVFDDENLAFDFLSKVSYYRLRAYTYPFQNNENDSHIFLRKGICYDFMRDMLKIFSAKGSLAEYRLMGFPDGWENMGLWKNNGNI